MKSFAISFAFLAFGAAASAATVPIPGIVNTGASFTAGQVDSNYSFAAISGTAVGTGGYGVVTADSGFPLSVWLANSSRSKWLTPSANQAQSYDPSANGTYRWTMNFNLTGFDASTALLSGRWAADNTGSLFLNGSLISQITAPVEGHRSWTTISQVNTGFLAGANVLEFVVTNVGSPTGNPTGLRAEFASSVTAVPEPSSYAMLLAGLAAVAWVKRSRQAQR